MEAETPQTRLCHLLKVPDYDGYGFNLCAERGKPGHFIGKVDPCSPAAAAGLQDGDRIVHVNGTNVNNDHHRQVNRHSLVTTIYCRRALALALLTLALLMHVLSVTSSRCMSVICQKL